MHGCEAWVVGECIDVNASIQSREELERRKLRTNIHTLMVLPALIAGLNAFSPQSQGLWIAGAFVLLAVLAPLATWPLRRHGSYRPSYATGSLLLLNVFSIAAFLALPLAWLSHNDRLFWSLFLAMVLAVLLVGLAGVLRYNSVAHAQNLKSRYQTVAGQMIIRSRPTPHWGMKRETKSVTDIFLKIAFGFYALVIGLGVLMGGGSGIIILRIMQYILPIGGEIDQHATVMAGVAFVALPVMGFFLAPLWGGWRSLRKIEGQAQTESGKLDIFWQN